MLLRRQAGERVEDVRVVGGAGAADADDDRAKRGDGAGERGLADAQGGLDRRRGGDAGAAEIGFQVGRDAFEHEWIIASIFMF